MVFLENKLPFKETFDIYCKNFTLEDLDVSFEKKLALISLVCYLTKNAKNSNPNLNCYMVLKKITTGLRYPDDIIKAIACICEDLSKNQKEFPTFGIENKQVIPTIKEILSSYMPF